jgi:cytochrome c-type biogenesis protein CcmH/NrfF
MSRSRALRIVTAALIATLLASPQALAIGPAPRTSLTDVEYDVMCVSCHEPLAVAQSPQAEAERSYITMLIAQGQTKRQIEQALVAQYGTAVLARPPAHGFNLAIYILPPAVLLGGIVLLAFTLPKWRRRARDAAANPLPAGPKLSADDARRLDDDLRRFA